MRHPSWISVLAVTGLLGTALIGADPPDRQQAPPRPAVPDPAIPHARWDVVESLRDSLDAPRDPSDGGGRAWLDADTSSSSVSAGGRGQWQIVFEAGPLGINEGGRIIFLVSPFWGWSPPHTVSEDLPGYTRVTTDAEGVELTASGVEPPMMSIQIGGRRLDAGETVRIHYGAGEAQARADRYAERGSRFWIGVDGDGDGVHSFVADSPTVDIGPGPPSRLLVTVPTTTDPGIPITINLAVVDTLANALPSIEAPIAVALSSAPAWPGLPETVRFDPGDPAYRALTLPAPPEGIYRLTATTENMRASSNPLIVFPGATPIFWGDLHGHSNLSDGTGTPEDYFRYARDIAALDIVALTDHDHWGTLPLDAHPDMWKEIRDTTRAFHDPPRFITLLGYEWTSWIHGHRHVLYFDDNGEVFSSIDRRYESPLQLWEALRGKRALTFAHHSAGGPVPTNWNIAPDPELEPVTEVVSVHGVSEAADAPARIYRSIRGNFVRDALDRGYVLGFVGSGDSHDGHPGLAQIAGGPTGGLVAVFAPELTRDAVLDSLRQRRVYATSGARIYLRVSIEGYPMGTTVVAHDAKNADAIAAQAQLRIRVVGTDEIERVEVIRSGAIVNEAEVDGPQATLGTTVENLASGEYVYVRIIQADGSMAWSSPIFVR